MRTHSPHVHIRRPRSIRAVAVLVAATLGLLGLPLIASPASAATATPTFKQVRAKEITSGTLNSLAFNSANTAGNLIVVYLAWTNTDSVVGHRHSRQRPYAVSEARKTWGANSNTSSQVFYAKNIAGGSNTVRATFATAITSWGDMYIHEYSGIDKADPLDVSAVNKGTTAAMNSGSATTTNANDLIFGAGASASNVNQAGTGFTSRSTSFGNRTEDKNVTAAGSYNATAKPEWQCVGHAHGGIQGGPGYSRHHASVDADGPHCNAHIDLADQSDVERKHR